MAGYIFNKVKTIRLTRVLLLFLMLSVSLTTTSAQTENSSRIYDLQHPLVYVDVWDLYPYVFLNDDGEAGGYNIDLLHMIFKELNIPFVVKLKPSKVALDDLKSGRSDLMLGMDAPFHHDYTRYYGKSVVQMFTHSVVHQKGHPALISEFQDLSNRQTIVHDGSFSHFLMQRRGWDKLAIPYEDMKEALQHACTDSKSRVLWNTISLKWLINSMHLDNLELTPVKMAHGEYRFMSNDSCLLHRMDSVFSELSYTGRLHAIQNKWFYPERRDSGIPTWIWKVLMVLAAFLLLTFLYYFGYRKREQKMTRELRRSNKRLSLILKTCGVRIWVLHVSSKTVSMYHEMGREKDDVALNEFLQPIRYQDAKRVVEALNSITAQQVEQVTLDVMLKDEHEDMMHHITIGLAVQHRDKNGCPTEIIGTSSDVTDEHARQLKVKDNMLRYRSIFNAAMVDTITYDADGYMTDMNDSASRAFPGGKEHALAERFCLADVLGDSMPAMEDLQQMNLTRLYKPDQDQRIFNSDLHDDQMYYELQIVPVRNEQGRLLTVFGTGRDVSEMVHSYQQLRHNAEQMEQKNNEMRTYIDNIDFVLKNGGVRIVEYFPDSQHLSVYSAVGQVQEELPKERILALTDVSSKKMVRQVLNSMDGHSFSIQATSVKTVLVTKKGHPLSLYFSFVPVTDDQGTVRKYFGMCRDISAIKAAEEQLAEETAKAQEVETVKSAFLRNMSYEIRTPLNSVVGFAELFSMEHDAKDESFFINEIKDNSDHLLKLINDILFLSRLDARMIEFKIQPIDFPTYFDSASRLAWDNHRREGINFVVDNPYQRLMVEIDPQNVAVVIEQLVANSSEHSTSGQIHVSCDYNGAELTIAVQDTGSGISQERLSQIFERFGSSSGSGTGLGLPICYEIIHQMNGHIRIKSEVGVGTIVWVTIPCTCTEIQRLSSREEVS